MRSSLLVLALGLAACPGDAASSADLSVPRDSTLLFVDAGPTDGVLDVAAVDQPVDTRPPFPFLELNHLLCTGQSLSVGSQGKPTLSTTQPFANQMFSTGVLAGGTNLIALAPLVEGAVETMSSGLANLVTQLARDEVFKGRAPPQDSHDLLVSCHGVGGWAYAKLKKGTVPYQNGMAQVTAAKAIALAAGQSYGVRGVTVIHGESDHVAGNKLYAENLAEWQADYEADVTAITGQTLPVPMFHSQIVELDALRPSRLDHPAAAARRQRG